MGYIYLLENIIGDEIKYKIGFTKNLNKRIKQLNTGNPGDLNIVKFYETKWGKTLESFIHRKYKKNKIKNEWFDLDNYHIDNFLIDCEKSEKILNALEKNYFFKKSIN